MLGLHTLSLNICVLPFFFFCLSRNVKCIDKGHVVGRGKQWPRFPSLSECMSLPHHWAESSGSGSASGSCHETHLGQWNINKHFTSRSLGSAWIMYLSCSAFCLHPENTPVWGWKTWGTEASHSSHFKEGHPRSAQSQPTPTSAQFPTR